MDRTWGRLRQLQTIGFLLVPLLFLAAGDTALANPGKPVPSSNSPVIEEALVTFGDETNCQADEGNPQAVDTLTIIGIRLTGQTGVSPAVFLGSIPEPLTICENSDDLIVAQLPQDIVHGDYLLSVAVGDGFGTFGLTIGAVGPAGQSFALECEHNQVAKYNALSQRWQCAHLNAVVGDSQGFSEGGEFVVPEEVEVILVEVWGPGGNGGLNYTTNSTLDAHFSGGGGGSGGYSERKVSVTPGQVFSVSIDFDESVVDSDELDSPIVSSSGEVGTNATSSSAGIGGAGGLGETEAGNPGSDGLQRPSCSLFTLYCDPLPLAEGGAAVIDSFGEPPPDGASSGGKSASLGATGYVLIRW